MMDKTTNNLFAGPVRVAVFAYNEQRNIAKSLARLLKEGEGLRDYRIEVLVNGSSDQTYNIAQQYAEQHPQRIVAHCFEQGDKARTWNRYVHNVATDLTQASVHVFTDADVWPEPGSIQRMADELANEQSFAAIGGLPMSGRNCLHYQQLAKDKHLIFGNLYATRGSWLAWARQIDLRLPVGMVFEDAALTNAFATLPEDLRKADLKRVGHIDGCGYRFTPIRPWNITDLSLYVHRMVRYRLAKKQLARLGWCWPDQLPSSMDDINREVLDDLRASKRRTNVVDSLLSRRLERQYRSKAA